MKLFASDLEFFFHKAEYQGIKVDFFQQIFRKLHLDKLDFENGTLKSFSF